MSPNEATLILHELFNSLKPYSFPINIALLPSDGIYILFEKGEKYNQWNRIVRIGSHRGNNRFIKRINNHFDEEKQRNSVFRKHIGRCLLNKKHDSYLENWDLPFKKKEDIEKYKSKVNLSYELQYEKLITSYIRNNFSFVVIPNIQSASQRLNLEASLIGTIAQESISSASENWLGKYHPDDKINQGKLWNIQHLSSNNLITKDDIELIEKLTLRNQNSRHLLND